MFAARSSPRVVRDNVGAENFATDLNVAKIPTALLPYRGNTNDGERRAPLWRVG